MHDRDGNDRAALEDAAEDEQDLEHFPLREGIETGDPFLMPEEDAALIQRLYSWMRAFYHVRYGNRMLRPAGTFFELYMLISQFQTAYRAYYATEAPERVQMRASIAARFSDLCPEPWTSSYRDRMVCSRLPSSSDDDTDSREADRRRHNHNHKRLPQPATEREHARLVAAFDAHEQGPSQRPWSPTDLAPVVWSVVVVAHIPSLFLLFLFVLA